MTRAPLCHWLVFYFIVVRLASTFHGLAKTVVHLHAQGSAFSPCSYCGGSIDDLLLNTPCSSVNTTLTVTTLFQMW